MTLDSAVFRFAGIVVLVSLALAHWVHPGFLWLTAFAGFNLLQSSFTGFCPAAVVFKKLGVRPGHSFN
ncbi:MAG: DUF2892 domain-containing protein [Sphingomonadales bacterium]|nr:DUF2892 domain-containing protein [Sphingomonadales bacterium]MBU3991239.1 DUF2892 domain-containing protein [Alphaproteobacteria bacterium]